MRSSRADSVDVSTSRQLAARSLIPLRCGLEQKEEEAAGGQAHLYPRYIPFLLVIRVLQVQLHLTMAASVAAFKVRYLSFELC